MENDAVSGDAIARGNRHDQGEGKQDAQCEGRHPERDEDADGGDRDEGADHVDVAEGKVEDADDAADQRIADGDEGDDRAVGQSVYHQLQRVEQRHADGLRGKIAVRRSEIGNPRDLPVEALALERAAQPGEALLAQSAIDIARDHGQFHLVFALRAAALKAAGDAMLRSGTARLAHGDSGDDAMCDAPVRRSYEPVDAVPGEEYLRNLFA